MVALEGQADDAWLTTPLERLAASAILRRPANKSRAVLSMQSGLAASPRGNTSSDLTCSAR